MAPNGSKPTVKRAGRKSELSPEPEELTLWREIIEHRDRLVRIVQSEDRDVRLTRKFLDRERRRGASRRLVAELFFESLQEIRAEVDAARDQLEQLDAALQRRPRKASPPRKLAEQLRRDLLAHACDAVRAYIRDPEREDYAQGAVDAVARIFGGRTAPVLDLVQDARAQQRAGDRSGSSVARYVVARVARLPPDSRVLREPTR